MGTGIKTRIVKIGNSRGIRIPKVFLEQAELGDDVEIEVQGDQIVIRPVRGRRTGWDEQFAEMTGRGDDRLLDSEGEGLAGRASELTGIKEKTILVKLGLEALIARESGKRLARLGGTEKQLKMVPRRRTAGR